jgi:hypothetical protein
MKKLEFKIACGLGDNIVLRMALDTVKHNYSQIRIAHNKDIVKDLRNSDPKYYKFLNDLGNLLFTEPPYIFDQGTYPEIYTYNTYKDLNIKIIEPKLDHLLCKGVSLNLNTEYIVVTTRARSVLKTALLPLLTDFCKTLKLLSTKYKIVIMGERIIDNTLQKDRGTIHEIFSIYEQIIANIPSECVIDLTVPALGVTSPTLSQMQRDCLIMKESKLVITFGIGGNVWMSAAVANTIGFRTADNNTITDIVINPQFKNIFITQDWQQFIQKLKEYIC